MLNEKQVFKKKSIIKMTQIFPDIQEWYANKQTNKPAHTSPVQHVLWRPDKQKNRKKK